MAGYGVVQVVLFLNFVIAIAASFAWFGIDPVPGIKSATVISYTVYALFAGGLALW